MYLWHWRSEIQSIKVLPCWDPRWVGIKDDESYNKISMASRSAKKRSKKISNTDSDDTFLASQTSQSSSSSQPQKNPMFLDFF